MTGLKAALQRFLREKRCYACTAPFEFSGAVHRLLRPDAPAEAERLFCPQCAARILKTDFPLCALCAEALPKGYPPGLCGECSLAPPPWKSLFLVGPYEGLLREMLVGLKFGGRLFQGHALSCLLAASVTTNQTPDALVPVPLHQKRLSARGFNQALELARPVAARLGLPLCPDWLRRPVASAPQAGLDKRRRAENTRGVFEAAPEVRGKSVMLLDDVLTTGSTLRSATHCLLEAGAARVDVAVVARTLSRVD